jgi:hypothetical protein
MKVDGGVLVDDPAEAGPLARRLEVAGYDGGFSFEGRHDPFLPLAVAAQQTERLELMTGIAIAFARNPMLLANLGYDLQLLSKGRFILGLGTQIRPHIERRFSMTWSHPARRMRELVLAVRAIWDCWQNGTRLDFRGEFYSHTLMTPVFPWPAAHLLCRRRSAHDRGGRRGGGRVLRASVPHRRLPALLVDPGPRAGPRARGPQARGLRDRRPGHPGDGRHGGGARGGAQRTQLNQLSKRGGWLEMAGLVDDELLEQVAVVGPRDRIPKLLLERYGGLVDRLALVAPFAPDERLWSDIVAAVKAA